MVFLSTKNNWWYNKKFFNKVKKYFKINNEIINITLLKKIEFENIIDYKNNNSKNFYCIIETPNLCNLMTNNINFYFSDIFRQKLFNNLIDINIKRNIIISIHIRRGDVIETNSRRYSNDNVYINILNNIIKSNKLDNNYEIHLFSEKKFNGNIELYKIFKNINIHLEKENGFNNLENVFNDLLFMINSDYLICSKSSFSYFPALLNLNGKIYHNNKFWINPLKHFNIYDDITGELI